MNIQKFKISLLTTSLFLAASTAQAGHPDNDDLLVRARVVSSSPIYESINTPRKECWNESTGYERSSYRNNNTGGSIIGAVAGGLLGSTVGKGNGRVAAAAVAAATGAVIGGRWNNGDHDNRYPQQVERCQTTDNIRQVVNGYDVRYRYQGREFNTRLPYDPGEWVMLKVNFTVAENQRGGNQRGGRFRNNDEWNDN
jgi:uncharacterized protein YcfJ